MGVLLGVTGAIGCGKTTFARCLALLEPSHAVYETGHLIAEIANAFNRALYAELTFEPSSHNIQLANQVVIWLPDALSESVHCDVAWDQLAITKHDVLANPELYSMLFAYLHTARQRPNLASQPITAANKAAYRPLLQWLGGYLVAKVSKTVWYDEIFRRIAAHASNKNLVIINGVRYPSDAQVVRLHGGHILQIERPGLINNHSDTTEAQRSAIVPDAVLCNNGPLTALTSVTAKIWHDLLRGTIKKRYVAQ